MNIPSAYCLVVLVLAALSATGCTIKGTINQMTDTTSNVTGTTSGAAWWNEDGQIKPDLKAAAFATANGRNLERDIAAGGGEYLTSLSLLLGVPEDRQPALFSAAQAQYAQTAGERAMDPEGWHLFLQNTAAALR